MHQSGDFTTLPNDFSTTNWDKLTRTFLDIIEKDLTDADWHIDWVNLELKQLVPRSVPLLRNLYVSLSFLLTPHPHLD